MFIIVHEANLSLLPSEAQLPGTMEPLVSLPLMSIGNDSMMSSSGSLKFNQFNNSITPLGIK